jgi:hypothetical protein
MYYPIIINKFFPPIPYIFLPLMGHYFLNTQLVSIFILILWILFYYFPKFFDYSVKLIN